MLKNISHSLITRLMLYFFAAGLLLVASFGINFAIGLQVHFKNEILPNISQYLVYVTQDIGTPPDIQQAKTLSRKLNLKVRIIGPELDWKSSRSRFRINELKFESAPAPYEDFKIARRGQHNFIFIEKGGYKYYFSMGKSRRSPPIFRNTVFVGFLIISIILLFVFIKRSLKPLKEISDGVDQIAKGDLDSPINIKGSFELEQLADGVNTMASDIKMMLEAKQQLLLAISHELRSPITRAQVNLELLPEDEIQQALKHDLKEMESLIAQILESQRLNQAHSVLSKTQFSFNELINEVVANYFDQKSLTLELETIEIFADKTRLLLLVKNLIDNAIKYSIETQAPVIRLFERNNHIILEVEDYGIGIEEDELDKITQAFYRVDLARQRATGGFGLGLYLGHLIVKAHQADITFTSQINKGTTVTITFPKLLE